MAPVFRAKRAKVAAGAHTFAATFALLVLSLAFGGDARAWGPEGYSYAAALAVEGLPTGPLKSFYLGNTVWLETNAGLSDLWRLRGDRTEPPRHRCYLAQLSPSSSDPRIAFKGKSDDEVQAVGILPWTVARHYRLLSAALRQRRFPDAMVETAFLSGYAADACEPFRATDSGGDADVPGTVARRFETGLIRQGVTYRDLNDPAPPPLTSVYADLPFGFDPVRAALNALAAAAADAPRVLAADSLAGSDAAANGPQNDVYWSLFATGARPTAIRRITAGGRLLSSLLLAAWNDAGRPSLPSKFQMTDDLLPFVPPPQAVNALHFATLPPVSDDARDAARDHVRNMTITSALLHRDVHATIILPLGYDTDTRRYPVLYLLHGSSGNENDWPHKSGIAAYAETLPVIVVMPGAGDSWYVDSPKQGAFESFIVSELVPGVDRSLRTLRRRDGRSVAGNSMGGYGAWRLALDHPELFCCAASLSGALDMGVSDPTDGEPHDWFTGLYGNPDDKKALRAYTDDALYRRIDSLTRRGRWLGPALRFDAGWDDYLLPGDRHMARYLFDRGLPYEYAEFPGSHEWRYWDEHIRDALNFVLRHVAAPAPR